VITYGPEGVIEQEIQTPEAIAQFVGRWPVVWVNVDGLGDVDTIRQIGEIFSLHGLALEDVVNVHQRPKVEAYEKYLFVVLHMLLAGERLATEQLSLFLGSNFVLTFQERPGGDSFALVRDRVRKNQGRIRTAGSDYLAYALLDAVVDSYFPALEQYGERLDAIEQEVITRPDRDTASNINRIKRDLLVLRRALWPLREIINSLLREGTALLAEETRTHLRDCYDHAVQIIDLLETDRETAFGLLDFYLLSISNRTNEIMKLLTIIATIFIPLSFIASVYGMNFRPEASPWNMPELNWYWGYPLALGLMAAVTAGLLRYFRRKGWLG